MKLVELINSVEALNILGENKLPAKTSFKLGKFMREASKDVEDYYKVRNEKMGIYGDKVMETVVAEDGTETQKETDKYSFTKENGEKFIADLKELEDSEVTISIPELKLDDLGSVTIEPKYLSLLEWLIKE